MSKDPSQSNSGLVLETNRLLITEWAAEDADAWYVLSQDSGLNSFTFFTFKQKDPYSAQVWISMMREKFWKDKMSFLPIRKKEGNVLIGIVGIRPVQFDNDPAVRNELTCRIAHAYTGRKYGLEATAALLEYGLVDMMLPEVVMFLDPANAGGKRMAGKLKMHLEQTTTYKNMPCDVYVRTS